MPIHAMIEKQQVAGTARGALRMQLRFGVPGSADGIPDMVVIIHNMSATGMLIETASDLAIDQRIIVALPEAPDCAATVVWRSERLAGCRFDRPLSRAVLGAAKLRNPLPPDFDPAAATVDPAETVGSALFLSERLLRLRREHGLSRAALSARTGLSRPSIWAWETGRAVPRQSSLAALAQAFGISAREIVTGGLEGPASESLDNRDAAEQLQSLIDNRLQTWPGLRPGASRLPSSFDGLFAWIARVHRLCCWPEIPTLNDRSAVCFRIYRRSGSKCCGWTPRLANCLGQSKPNMRASAAIAIAGAVCKP